MHIEQIGNANFCHDDFLMEIFQFPMTHRFLLNALDETRPSHQLILFFQLNALFSGDYCLFHLTHLYTNKMHLIYPNRAV